jgi:arginase
MFFIYINLLTFVNILNVPYDHGANILGSSKAYETLRPELDKLKIEKTYNIETQDRHIRDILSDSFFYSREILNKNNKPLLIGGDHTIAVSNIAAANEYCKINNYRFGVIWFDAHADFNTMETSPSKNIHGTPISILCGHTLPMLNMCFEPMDPFQFNYYGLRDYDSLEFFRIQEYNMKILEDDIELKNVMSLYDKIHISFDMDCLDPKSFDKVNTKVKNGLQIQNVLNSLKIIKESNKLLSMDIVEYNPTILSSNITNEESNKIITSIIQKSFDI